MSLSTSAKRDHSLGPLAVMLLAVLVLGLGVVRADINMALIAGLPHTFSGMMPCGDANHNGRQEIYGTDHWCDTLAIFENQGESFREVRTQMYVGLLLALGEPGGDSLAVLLAGLRTGATLFRSLSPDTFPTESVWTFVGGPAGRHATFADLDQDGRCEVIRSDNNDRGIRVFEYHQGHYDSVPFPSERSTGGIAIDDFDVDGLLELATGSIGGFLYVYECLGDDQYVLTLDTCLQPEQEIYDLAATSDMDQDGLPEFVFIDRQTNDMAHVHVYEEPTHNSFQSVWHRQYPCDWSNHPITAGDVNGDGINEFAFSTGFEVRLFQCTGPDQYEQVWLYPRGADRMRLYDINSDGRDELIIGSDSCLIFEDTSGLSLIAEYTSRYRPSLPRVRPSISVHGAPVLFTELVAGSMVTIYNSFGAVIRSEPVVAQRQLRWDLTDNQRRQVPTGTYFAVVRGQGQSSRVKLCVVK